MALNVVTLVGRLTADPETRSFTRGDGSESSIANFTLAVDRRGKDAGADFIRCSAFGASADFVAKYFHKGDMMATKGRITTNTKTNDDGSKTTYTGVSVDEISFCGGKNSNSNSGDTPSAPKAVAPDIDDDTDLPF